MVISQWDMLACLQSQFTVRSFYIQLYIAFFYVASFPRILECLSNVYQSVGKTKCPMPSVHSECYCTL